MSRSTNGDSLGAKVLLALATVLLMLGGTEIALSWLHPTEYLRVPEKSPGDPFYGLLHRRSEYPDLLYELVPNQQKKFERVWIRTNSYGMRDTEPQPIDDGVPRIVVLGDSFSFGFRVAGEAAYPSVLERRLRQKPGWSSLEVLNLGVCGYNTRDEAAVLRHKGLVWQPDLIVLGYVLNDPETDPVQPLDSYFQEPFLWQRFNLARLVAKAKHGLDLRIRGGGDYYRYLHSPTYDKWASVIAGMDEIRRLARDVADTPVLVVIFPDKPATRHEWEDYPYADIHRQVAELARSEGFAVIDLLDRFSRFPARTMRVRRNDPHPSVQGHDVAAAAIEEWIDTYSIPSAAASNG